MMIQAFYTGISGMKSTQTAIDVISDNLSNVSTVGFRGYETEFAPMFEEQLNTASLNSSLTNSVGLGTRLNQTSMITETGSVFLSDKSTDLAISGDGWFGIESNNAKAFTRDGSFVFDANNDLVTNDGHYVLGTLGGNIAGGVLTQTLADVPLGDVAAQTKLQFPRDLKFPQQATTTATFIGNLGVTGEPSTITASPFDGKRNRNALQLSFTKSATQVLPGSQWDVVATTKTLDGLTTYDTQTGTMNFAADGLLISSTLTSVDNNGTAVKIDVGSGFTGIVSTAATTLASSTSVDGIQAGDLVGYDINKDGEVIATFSNTRQSSVGQIAVYHFQNDQGLTRISGTRFTQSPNSGDAIFYKDAAGKNIIGTNLTNYKLEGSNIEMTYGITELIIMQRAYDANSKSITTSDQMMQKALNMDA